MNYDIVLAGVGGQGILSIAFILDNSALSEGLNFQQSEIHGMSQRGGAVSAQIRVSDKEIFSEIIPMGKADMILSVEPMEALRYIDFLSPEGVLVTSMTPFNNIQDYPDLEQLNNILLQRKNIVALDSKAISLKAGSPKSQNMVMLGAASPFIPIKQEVLEQYIHILFKRKGEKIINKNITAFNYGKKIGQIFEQFLPQNTATSIFKSISSSDIENLSLDNFNV